MIFPLLALLDVTIKTFHLFHETKKKACSHHHIIPTAGLVFVLLMLSGRNRRRVTELMFISVFPNTSLSYKEHSKELYH